MQKCISALGCAAEHSMSSGEVGGRRQAAGSRTQASREAWGRRSRDAVLRLSSFLKPPWRPLLTSRLGARQESNVEGADGSSHFIILPSISYRVLPSVRLSCADDRNELVAGRRHSNVHRRWDVACSHRCSSSNAALDEFCGLQVRLDQPYSMAFAALGIALASGSRSSASLSRRWAPCWRL